MKTDFKVIAALPEKFQHLFAMNEAELANLGARRMTVDHKPGFPCRVSLQDAEIGETVILTTFAHHEVNSPYQSSGPVFVRERVPAASMAINEVPDMLKERLLSIRAYNESGMMVGATVVEGQATETVIRQFFEQIEVAYLHVHNANPGCFNCTVERA